MKFASERSSGTFSHMERLLFAGLQTSALRLPCVDEGASRQLLRRKLMLHLLLCSQFGQMLSNSRVGCIAQYAALARLLHSHPRSLVTTEQLHTHPAFPGSTDVQQSQSAGAQLRPAESLTIAHCLVLQAPRVWQGLMTTATGTPHGWRPPWTRCAPSPSCAVGMSCIQVAEVQALHQPQLVCSTWMMDMATFVCATSNRKVA